MKLSGWKQLYESEDFKEKYECPQERFGAFYSKDETLFRLWSPLAKEVTLCFHATGTDEELNDVNFETYDTMNYAQAVNKYGNQIAMAERENGIWEVTLSGDLKGVYYTYCISMNKKASDVCEMVKEDSDVSGKAAVSYDTVADTMEEPDETEEYVETVDPYAMAVGANGKRSMVVDMEDTNPVDWDKDDSFVRSADSAVIYELHVKDFSNDPHSGISEEYRGKYLAFTEEGTTVDNEGLFSSGIDYLKELGITHVHLLPTYDFGSMDELGADDQFNWGYDPVNYRVPEGSYATDAKHGETRIFEFKQMVKALHDAGIGVILDMVFNHTFELDSPLQRCVPYYYYRQNPDGSLRNGSGCGNETASERAMYRSYIIDTVLFWANEYHIDGFRFDLMGVHDADTMNELRSALDASPKGKHILLYGEPWSAEPVEIPGGGVPANKANVRKLHERVAIFHDGTRDAIKGSVFEAKEGGFVNGGDVSPEEIKHSVLAWCDTKESDTPKSPKQVISYVSAHDNYTLWDKLALTMDENTDYEHGNDSMLKTNKLIAAMLQFSLGTPFFQAGEEFARTKLGDENSYISAPSINQLDWRRRVSKNDLVEYYKGLIGLRKLCTIFTSEKTEVTDHFHFEILDESCVSYRITKTGCLRWSQLYVVFNAGKEKRGIQIPEGSWQILVDDNASQHYLKNSVIVASSMMVAPHSALILGKMTKLDEKWEERRSNRKGSKTMDFLNKVSEKLTETGKYAAGVVKETSEMISLKNQISSLKKSNKEVYEEIGRKVAEREANNPESEYKAMLEKISRNQEEADRLQQKLDLMRDRK